MPDSDYDRVDGLLDQVLDVKLTCDASQFRRGIARLRLAVMYAGPWERLEMRLPSDGAVWVGLARWVNRRDVAWQDRHIAGDVDPAERWRRRPSGACGLDES